jgi:signal transduction histidine kinase/streptogramin lyase
LRFDRDRHVFIHYGHRPEDPLTIAEDKVITLFEDRSGNIWTGLHSKGPNVLAQSSMGFETYRHVPDEPNSLTLDFVNALYEDSRGFLWIGNDDGLNRIDRRTGVRTSWAGGLGSKPMVITIVEDSAGFIWFGTFGHGLGRLDPRSGQVKSYRHDASNPNSLSNDEVHRLLVDQSGTLWVGTDDGLDRFNAVQDNFTVYKVDSNSRRSQSYVAMAAGSDGTLWLGSHYSGLHHFDPLSGTFKIYRSIPGDPGSLRDNMVPTVYADSAGVIWIGTQNGLNRLDPTNGRLTSFGVKAGPSGNTVSCLLEDDSGNLWIGTNRGLSRFNQKEGTLVNYSVADGLPGNDFTGWGACNRNHRGEMFFGGFAGAVAFAPERLHEATSVIPVVLTEFQISGADVQIGPDSPLRRAISYTNHVTLSHAQSVFSIGFAGLNFLSPDATRYRYRLEGLDQEWTEVDSRRRRSTYTILPPGKYTFRVQAATARASWNGTGATLDLVILPPWWATWWFRVFCALILMLAAFVAYRIRMRQIIQRVSLRMQERIDERSRIARELHDSLLQGAQGLIFRLQAIREMLPGNPSEAAVELDRALDRGDQTLAEARDAVTGIRVKFPGGDDIVSALRALSTESSESGLARPSPSFRVLVEGRTRPLRELIRDDIYQIAREAFRNATMHAHANNVEVELRYSNAYFVLRVRDDGCGMNASTVLKQMNEGHWGIQGMRERAAAMGGQFQIWSEDKAGTEIQLRLPAVVAYADVRGSTRQSTLIDDAKM